MRIAQVLIIVVEIAASGIVASVCIYRIGGGSSQNDMLRSITRGGGELTVSGRESAASC